MTEETKSYLLSTALALVRLPVAIPQRYEISCDPAGVGAVYLEYEIRKIILPLNSWRLQAEGPPFRPIPNRGDEVSLLGRDVLVESVEINRKTEEILLRVWVQL
jgi:hypothetical protein